MPGKKSDYYRGNQNVLFLQSGGVGSAVPYLNCHAMDGLDQDRGAIEQAVCPDPDNSDKWVVISEARGPQGRVTGTVTVPMGKTQIALEELVEMGCGGNLFVLHKCDRSRFFSGWDRVEAVEDFAITGDPIAGLVSRDAAPETMMSFPISAREKIKYYKLAGTDIATLAATAFTDVTFCDEDVCASACGPFRRRCTVGFAIPSVPAGPATCYITLNGGVTWAATAGAAALGAAAATSIVCFPISDTQTRVMMTRASLAATAPQIAYSDDLGATAWTVVTLPGVVTEGCPWNGCLFALDMWNIWLVTETAPAGVAGSCYKSTDGGLTWAQQALTATDSLNCVRFRDQNIGLCVGDTNEINFTRDGGEHWAAIAGPVAMAAVDALTCIPCDEYQWYVGYEGGQLYRTDNGGTTWNVVTITRPVAWTAWAGLNDMRCYQNNANDIWVAIHYVGAAAAIRGTVMHSINGGVTWEEYTHPIDFTAGQPALVSLHVCDYNHAFAVGGMQAATATVWEVAK